MDRRLLERLKALVGADDGQAAVQSLAAYLGCSDLLVFILDMDIGIALPAPGFPKTLPDGVTWKRFLADCTPGSTRRSRQMFPGSTAPTDVVAVTAEDGTVLVLGGGEPRTNQLAAVCLVLPLLSAAFRGEQMARSARAQSVVAEHAARSAENLARTLDATRQELQLALIEAERALRVRDEFLSIASHELKTPLTGLMLQIQMIRRAADRLGESTPGVRAILTLGTSMERSLKRLVVLTNDLLDVSRITAGRLDMRPEQMRLDILAREVVERFSDDADRRGSTMTLDVAEPVVGYWDPSRLDQVVTNLVANALAHGKGSPVKVRVTNGSAGARIEVQDHGPGIAAEDQERIFLRFERAQLKSDGSGLGLGLHITREIIHAHAGHVFVESRLGSGATFVVELPYGQ